MPRLPLSQRLADDPDPSWTGPHDGVPPWLLTSLLGWITPSFPDFNEYGLTHELLQLERELHLPIGSPNSQAAMENLVHRMIQNQGVALDVVDWCVESASGVRLAHLEEILEQAGSAYTVTARDPIGGELTKRLDKTQAAAVQQAAPAGSEAARHLATAWSRIYRRNPDPSGGYSEVVRAVESAAIPVVSPKHRTATLGTVIGDLKAHKDQWSVALEAEKVSPEIEVVISMLDLLWGAQTDRHGVPDDSGPVEISQSAAESALHLAGTLVHWFTIGAIRRAR